MDELEQFLGGGTATAKKPPAPSGPSVITDQLLDSLRRTESGKDRFALNKQTKAMGPYQFMPETVQMLHKQGIEFNPFNEQEARAAAKGYLETLVARNKGDVNKALADYGGFVTKDPTQYVNKVLQGQQNAQPAQQTQQTQQVQQVQQAQPAGDELEAFLSGGKAAPAKPVTQPAVQAASPAQQAQPVQAATENQPISRRIADIAARTFNKYQEGKRELGERVAGAIDTAYGIVPVAYGAGVQALARTANTPERAAEIGRVAEQSIAQPVGKALGITGKETYQKPLGGITEPVVEQVRNMAEKLGLTAQQISQKTGIPEQDIKNMALTASFALPQAIKEVAPVAKQAAGAVTQPIREAAAELQIVKPGTMTKEQAAADFAARQGKAGSVGSAKVEFNPYAGQITGEEVARGQFPQVKLSKTPTNVAPTEQATRSAIAQEILGEGQPVRTGVITGNENTLRTEHAKAKMPDATPEGQLLKQQIANEQTALSNYAQQRIDNTGASPTLVTPYERGERINSAFTGDEGLTGFLKQEKRSLYDEANARTGGNPIQSTNVENLLADKQFKAGLGLKGNEGVARSAEELINLAKNVGFKDDMGNVYAPNTVGAWTAVQKSLNSNWTPQNASIIRKINQAIERDIGAAGGLDLLKKADQLHQAEKVLFGSKGIKQIFGDIDPNGVQTATAFEAIPQKLNSMPVDQWKHIYETAEKVAKGTIDGPIDKATGMPKWSIEVPEELRVSAQSAMNEMRGNIAREIYQAGAAKAGEWNQNAVNKILNARADKIKLAFSPEEQKAFHTLNMGGYLMPGVHGYEGAGLQGRRVQGIVEGNLGKMGAGAGATLGGTIAGAPGAAVGGYLGGQAGLKAAGRMEARALQKAAEKTQKEMLKNAQMGKNNANDMLKAGKK